MVEFLFHHWPIVFVVSATMLAWGFAKLILNDEKLPYEKRPTLLTDPQLLFYKALNEAVKGDWAIQAKVPLPKFLQVKSGASKSQTWQNRLGAHGVDFLLCDHGTMEAQLAVKLDEPADDEAPPGQRDRFMDHAFHDAGLPLLRIEIKNSYDAGGLRKTIDEQLGPSNH